MTIPTSRYPWWYLTIAPSCGINHNAYTQQLEMIAAHKTFVLPGKRALSISLNESLLDSILLKLRGGVQPL